MYNFKLFKKLYKFNGKELDEETGFFYCGAGYYDPKVSIWLSVDPLAQLFPTHNPYNYCFENTIMFKDLTGMVPEGGDEGDPPYITHCFDEVENSYRGDISSSNDNSIKNSRKVNDWKVFAGKDLGGYFKSQNSTIQSLTGSPGYYTTNGDITEPNNIVQIQKGKYTGIYFKNKMNTFSNHVRYEATSAFEFGVRIYQKDFINYRGLEIGLEGFATAGPGVYIVEFEDDIQSEVYNSGPSKKFGGVNHLRGFGTSIIARFELKHNRFGFFSTVVLHWWESLAQQTSIGTQSSMFFGTIGVYSGISVELGHIKNND